MPEAAVALSWDLLIDEQPRAGFENMARDMSLLRAAAKGRSFLRLYRWSPGCLSFGRHEPALTRYDRTRVEQLGLDVVRRPTGGRAVWHDDEVTYAVAAPVDAFGSLRDSYVALHAMIARALSSLGARCELASAPRSRLPAPGAGSCFANPAGGEVVVDGWKLVGSAQTREGGAFLQHGSILLTNEQSVVTTVTRGLAAHPAATSLSAVLGKRIGFSEVATAIAREARDSWGPGRPGTESLTDPDLVSRFRDPVWTWRR